MKTITLSGFKSLVALPTWKHEQVLHVEMCDREEFDFDEQAQECSSHEYTEVFGGAEVISTLDGVTIRYQEGFSYHLHSPETFTAGIEGLSIVWEIYGLQVLDEDGDAVSASDLGDSLPEIFSEVNYKEHQIKQVTDFDYDGTSDMETFTLIIDNEPNLRFNGECIANVESSEQSGRWTELALYRTKGGKFVCHQIGYTQWVGERNRFSGHACETLEDVKAFFGHRWLAKELYESAGIPDFVEVE